MSTTIQVSDTTKQLLDTVKRRTGKNYDQIVHKLLAIHLKIRDSLAGAYPKLRWKKGARTKFRGK